MSVLELLDAITGAHNNWADAAANLKKVSREDFCLQLQKASHIVRYCDAMTGRASISQ